MGSQGFFQVLKRVLLFALIIGMMVIYAACSKKGDSTSFGSTGPGSSPSPSPSPSPLPPFEVQITSQYEAGSSTTGTITTEADCKIPVGSSIPTTLACTNSAGSATTSVAIPEGRLYFSSLTITEIIPTGQSNCEIAILQPFYYSAGSKTDNAFSPHWNTSGTPYDCTQSPPPVGCFGGPAIDMVPGFPKNTQLYYLASEGSSFSTTAHSAVYHNWGSNRFAVNNLVDKTTAHTWKLGVDAFTTTPPSGYAAWQDYYFACFDKYMDLQYAITLTITDIDTTPGANQPGNQTVNIYPDWNILSWDY